MEKPLTRYDVLGVQVSACDLTTACRLIRQRAESGGKGYVCFCGVHGVMESQRDATLQDIYNGAFINSPDGMPLVWLGKHRSEKSVGRVYGPDVLMALCEQTANTGLRHYFYGGGEGVAEALAARLKAQFPDLEVAGTYTPPFRDLTPEEEQQLISEVDAAQPHFFWVGLGTPKQDKFMHVWLSRLNVNLMLGVGAAFDFHSGRKPQAPRWMQRSGLEWLFRLITEPRRLARRYLVYNPIFVWKITQDYLFHQRK
ncbi:WecB/TagA/CpsF family glycosyltransferase [Cerasicoccus frondis]|uniref:WecB/TagA/CpsF family glycosyltransferase n=1 Tax=Cerasicoccus frondis TaxID=490090 RepID=UPI002852A7BB|nr:WecB/TagA/CpsF family glycosyltransferase [Cerasicoccus frondis]